MRQLPGVASKLPPLRPAAPPRGILHANEPSAEREHQRVLPPASLSEYIAHFWTVRWSLKEPELVETLPHPTVHVIFEEVRGASPRAEVVGVPRGRFTRRLEGEGDVFAIKFRPAMLQPFIVEDVGSLRGRVIALSELFAGENRQLENQIFGSNSLEERITAVERFLLPRIARISEQRFRELLPLRNLVESMETSRSLLRVEQAAALVDWDLRTLQRRFQRHLGVSPKWVILRYRLHEAAERLREANPPSLAALAAELGYADQAHFARDFSKIVGCSPARFSAAHRSVR
ncbi:MAG: AraC family transcriptional regulator [Myxococcota bacterium]